MLNNKKIFDHYKNEITEISLALFRKKIEIIKPLCIIFAIGYFVDSLIKKILPIRNKKKEPFIPKKLWTFNTTVDEPKMLCFRINHLAAIAKPKVGNELNKNQDIMINE